MLNQLLQSITSRNQQEEQISIYKNEAQIVFNKNSNEPT